MQSLRFAFACAFGFLVIALTGCGPESSAREMAEPVPPSVEAVPARTGSLPLVQRLSGVVRARNQVEIHPEIDAVVTEVLIENGARVQAGDPLVRLRDTEFRERLKQARAAERIARAELRGAKARAAEAAAARDRVVSLRGKDLSSDSELETVEAQAEGAAADVALAEARVEQAVATAEEQEQNLARTVVRSPISGVVGNRGVEVGMLVTSSTQLYTVGQLDSVTVDVILTDRMLGTIEEGQRAEITVGRATLSAPVARISPFLHPVAHSTQAEIDTPNPDLVLKPGMFVTVDVFYGESQQATLVPLSALYEDPVTGRTGVYRTSAALEAGPVDEVGIQRAAELSEPVTFEFVPTPPIARGRMEAAVRGIEPGTWIVIQGQNLLGGDEPTARVRPVTWERVERLQHLQREDLMQAVVERQSAE